MKIETPDEPFPSESIKEIPKWTRRYAQNRTVPFLLYMFMFLVWCYLAGTGSKLARLAYRAGDMTEFYFAMTIVVAMVAVLIWSLVPGWGGGWYQRLTRRIYKDGGDVVLPVPSKQTKYTWHRHLIPGVFVLGLLITVALTRLGYLSNEYVQPVSALYAVPFLIARFSTMRATMRETLGPIFLLWPILYGIHAILVVAGAPIQFEGQWASLNMLIPTIGYGILTGVVGYLAGQYSLKKLRGLTSMRDTEL